MNKRILLKAACGVYRVKCAEGQEGVTPNTSSLYDIPENQSCLTSAPQEPVSVLRGGRTPSHSVKATPAVRPSAASVRLKPLSPFIKEPPVPVPSGPKPMRLTRDPDVKSFKMYTMPYEPDPGSLWAKAPKGVDTWGRRLGTALPIGAGLYDVVQANQSQKDLREAWKRGDHIGSNGTIMNAANLANTGVDVAAILAQLGGYNNAAMWLSKPILPATAAVAGYQIVAGSTEDYTRRTEYIRNGKGLVPALDGAIARSRARDPAAGNTDDEIRAHNVKVRGGEIKQLKDNPEYVSPCLRESINAYAVW